VVGVSGCVALATMAVPAHGALMPSGGGQARKAARSKAKPKPKPKCKLVRRRRGKKWVWVRVCPKPTQASSTRQATRTSPVPAAPRAPSMPLSAAPTTTTSSSPSSTESSGGPGGSQMGATTTSQTAPSLPAGPSAWEEPALTDPIVVTLSAGDLSLKLNQSQDYIVQCPAGEFVVPSKITIWGGHNVVLQDCDEFVSNPAGDWAGDLEDQTGTLWVHDVHFGGAHLTGGVQMQEPGATVVMRDVLFDTVYGSYQTNHAECIQTWSGPARFLIDGLQCSTTYQGLFLLPNQWDSSTVETTWDFRNVQIDGDGAYDLWLGDVQPSNLGALGVFNLEDVYDCGSGEPRDYDGSSDSGQAWSGVRSCPAGGVSHPVWSNPDGTVTGDDDGTTAPAAVFGEQP
jgi:hypothetical protein